MKELTKMCLMLPIPVGVLVTMYIFTVYYGNAELASEILDTIYFVVCILFGFFVVLGLTLKRKKAIKNEYPS